LKSPQNITLFLTVGINRFFY